MKIAITTNTTDAGGAEKQRILLANSLAERGHEVLLVVLQRSGALNDLISPTVQIEEIPFFRRLPSAYEILLTGTTNTELTFGFLNRFGRRAEQWLAAIHNPVSASAPHLKRLSRLLIRVADARIALTPQHKSSLARYWHLDAEYVVSNAIPQRNRRVPSAAGKRRTGRLGYLGRIAIEHKGLDRLVRAMEEQVAAPLTINLAGSGPDEETLRQLIRGANLESRMCLTGFVEAEQFLQEVDGLVLLSRWEAQPMVLLEAAYAGIPVVQSSEIDPEAGVDADNPEAVAAALVELAAGRIDPLIASNRSTDLMAADYISVFQAVANQARSSRKGPNTPWSR